MSDALKQERDAFEKFAQSEGQNITRHDDNPNRYANSAIQGWWRSWQARAALSAPQPAEPQAGSLAAAWDQGFNAGEKWVEARQTFWETHEYGDSPKPQPNPYEVKP